MTANSLEVLIIDDSEANIELFSFLIREGGMTPLIARDGLSGVKIAFSRHPDLIVCDINMPDIDGFGVIRLLREAPETQATPVVAVTALAVSGDRERILAAGFDGYISKPISPEEFASSLRAFLPERRRNSSAS